MDTSPGFLGVLGRDFRGDESIPVQVKLRGDCSQEEEEEEAAALNVEVVMVAADKELWVECRRASGSRCSSGGMSDFHRAWVPFFSSMTQLSFIPGREASGE